jgi:hypothetical protein
MLFKFEPRNPVIYGRCLQCAFHLSEPDRVPVFGVQMPASQFVVVNAGDYSELRQQSVALGA